MQNEEQAIFRAQELDLIYSQSGLLYEIIPNAPRSSFDPKVKPRPHADGIVGSASKKLVGSIVKQVAQLYINQSTLGQALASSQPAQMANVLAMQSFDQKGNQQLGRNRKRVKTIIIRRVGIRMRMPIIMTRTIKMLGGTSRINVRLSFLASFVRMITSLTCSLGWMKLRSS